MRTFHLVILLPAILGLAGTARAQDERPQLDLGGMMQPVGDEHIFRDSTYFNWGSSIIRGDDGKYHLFYARWPRAINFTSWLTSSEIAHAIADDPAGPYRYVETVLQGQGGDNWDAVTAHNPKVKYFDGNYFLYYISTNGKPENLTAEEIRETGVVGYQHANWWLLRNNQRTGVALARSLEGPWTRMGAPVVEPAGPIVRLTVNPAVTRGPDGTYFMIVKGDRPGENKFLRNQAIALSPVPTGPFIIQPEPVIGDLDTEDASMWFNEADKRFYAIFHAHRLIGMMVSEDGIHWEKAEHYSVTDKTLRMQDGSTFAPDRLERPFVYVEDGTPRVISFAVRDGNDSFCIFVPLVEK